MVSTWTRRVSATRVMVGPCCANLREVQSVHLLPIVRAPALVNIQHHKLLSG